MTASPMHPSYPGSVGSTLVGRGGCSLGPAQPRSPYPLVHYHLDHLGAQSLSAGERTLRTLQRPALVLGPSAPRVASAAGMGVGGASGSRAGTPYLEGGGLSVARAGTPEYTRERARSLSRVYPHTLHITDTPSRAGIHHHRYAITGRHTPSQSQATCAR